MSGVGFVVTLLNLCTGFSRQSGCLSLGRVFWGAGRKKSEGMLFCRLIFDPWVFDIQISHQGVSRVPCPSDAGLGILVEA